MRLISKLQYAHADALIDLVLRASGQEERLMLLNSNARLFGSRSRYDFLLAIGSVDSMMVKRADEPAFERLNAFHDSHRDWMFGHLSYDLKNNIEKLSSSNFDGIGMPLMHFFVPELLLVAQKGSACWYAHPSLGDSAIRRVEALSAIGQGAGGTAPEGFNPALPMKTRMSEEEYHRKFERIQQHIRRGDVYELNFCREFYADRVTLHPLALYRKLNALSPAPFSAFYRLGSRFLLSASPERFLMKEGAVLRSQPIKGTAPRFSDPAEDKRSARALRNSLKEQAENVMIVDLVRNDLSRTAVPGSVTVDELFGIYPFARVWQMISTVSSRIKEGVSLGDSLQSTFPMGSMTGAPKVKAMELIEAYERTTRGLYSGSVGYIDPHGDFDFNVVIRSMLYNSRNAYLSFITGGALTAAAKASDEFSETLLKAEDLFAALR